MSSITEKIARLGQYKEEIKNAILSKGGLVDNDMSAYAGAIEDLPSGGEGLDQNTINVLCSSIILDTNVKNVTISAVADANGRKHGKMRDYAFYHQLHIEQVKVKNDITMIGSRAFEGCFNLRSVELPTTMQSVGSDVFYNCPKLESYRQPLTTNEAGSPNVMGFTLADQLLGNCTSLTEVIIPEGITKMQGKLFMGCTALTEINIPDTVMEFDGYTYSWEHGMFDQCTALETINFGNTRTTIPTLSTPQVFSDFTGRKYNIIVPDALYAEWIESTNWNTDFVASQIIPYSDWRAAHDPTKFFFIDARDFDALNAGSLNVQMTNDYSGTAGYKEFKVLSGESITTMPTGLLNETVAKVSVPDGVESINGFATSTAKIGYLDLGNNPDRVMPTISSDDVDNIYHIIVPDGKKDYYTSIPASKILTWTEAYCTITYNATASLESAGWLNNNATNAPVINTYDETTGDGLIVFGEPLKYIPYECFYAFNMSNADFSINSMTLPISVESIGERAFYMYADNVRNVFVPYTVGVFHGNAFWTGGDWTNPSTLDFGELRFRLPNLSTDSSDPLNDNNDGLWTLDCMKIIKAPSNLQSAIEGDIRWSHGWGQSQSNEREIVYY